MNIEENNFFQQLQTIRRYHQVPGGTGLPDPTRIQQSVIPLMLSGNNVLAKAPTGSGKTAAFGIPVCEHAVWEENLPQVLILEPTRELTEQVRDELFLIGRLKRLKVAAVYGGFPIDKQIRTLKQKSHMIVGTPGRLMDHIRRETLKLNKVSRVVIDEADLMLDMGFMDEVRQIVGLLPEKRQTLLFSATLDEDVKKLESRIRAIDAKRRDYYQYYSGNEWGKPKNYDLCLNSGTLGIERCVEIIANTVSLE